ncbi:MAG TPA: nucleoside-diphosphate sugar epimerase/dehydratase [Sphingomonas sp.]|nr:nucleoside-diphosphate sugar epimerase/dehydratase [Sphingomonas sp.]
MVSPDRPLPAAALPHRAGAAWLGRYAITRPRAVKRWAVIAVDAGLCALCCILSIFLRLGFLPDRDIPYGAMIGISISIALPIFYLFGLYREIFSQTGIRALTRIGRATAVYTLPFAVVFSTVGIVGIPRTVMLIQPILLFVALAASRVGARCWLFGTESLRRVPRRRVIIYGAGEAGRQLAGAIAQTSDMAVVGFVDDDPALIGAVLDGCRIYTPQDMGAAVARLTIDEILIALPSASPARRRAIIASARGTGARVRTLPALADLAGGRVGTAQLRDVAIEDLLGRQPIEPDLALMKQAITGRTVMVTGAGGSIGHEVCRQLVALEPALLLLVEISEFGLYEVHRALDALAAGRERAPRLVPLLRSVLDQARMDEIVATWRPDVIYHAAAYKHVPLVEHNPAEGIRTNLIGTWRMAEVAARHGVPDFVLVSTDKAVRPTNVMGATKRAAELVLQGFDAVTPGTRFSIVRFGNVLGSSGSVVPLFRQQIRAGGPVTLTDRRITRYFMTVAEAAALVLQAGAMAKGGEVFVLDMGAAVRIADLARNMIELAGLSVRDAADPGGDIEIVEIGLRPGEKLYEELLIGNAPELTAHPRILKANERFVPFDALGARIAAIEGALDHCRRADLIDRLRELVPEFHCQAGLVDWIDLELAQRPPLKRIA